MASLSSAGAGVKSGAGSAACAITENGSTARLAKRTILNTCITSSKIAPSDGKKLDGTHGSMRASIGPYRDRLWLLLGRLRQLLQFATIRRRIANHELFVMLAPSGSSPRNNAAQFIDNCIDQPRIIAFRHDANERLRTGGANDQSSRITKPRGRICNCALHLRVIQRFAALEFHVLQNLRNGFKHLAHFAYRLSCAFDLGKHLKCCQQTITRGRKVRQDDMARLFATNVKTVGSHMLNYIAVTNPRARQRKAPSLRKRSSPRLDMTVATRPPPLRCPRSCRDLVIRAIN